MRLPERRVIFDLKVPAMIATLGTQTIFRGILKLLCNGNSISFFEPVRRNVRQAL